MARARIEGIAIAGRNGRYDVEVADGRIETVTVSSKNAGGLLLPLFADAHVHLDKTFTEHRVEGEVNSLFDAIELMDCDKANWSEDDIRARAGRALERAYAHGVGAMRSHVDWPLAEIPIAWSVLNELKQEWRGRIELQLAALTPIDLAAEAGEDIAIRVAQDGGVFGAFIYRNERLAEKVGHVFKFAARRGLALDFHVDEGLEHEADGLSAIIEATARHGMAGRVLCGHACSLALREGDALSRILDAGAAAGVGLIVLPTTNLYLQDRTTHRAPRLRGIAPVKEARAAGIEVMFASDNCRDVFYPHGDYDVLDVFRTAVLACHIKPADWLDAITSLPARWCSTDVSELKSGSPADFVLFEAEDLTELVARSASARTVYRRGKPVVHSAMTQKEFDYG